MSAKLPANIPPALSAARRQIDKWRRRGSKRGRMPETLWRRATALAGKHGLNPTARALKLNYYSLKKRLTESASAETAPAPAQPDFIEIPPDILKSAPVECTIEWIDGDNSTVRMHIQGVGLSELTALAGVLRDGKA